MDAMLENGPSFIRNIPLILKKWIPNDNLLKDDVCNVPVWVNFHDVPITAFSVDGLSAIATKHGCKVFGHVMYEEFEVGFKPIKQVNQPVSKKNDLAEQGVNSDVVSSAIGTSSKAFGSPITSPLAERINDLERQMLDVELVLMDDDGKPLKKGFMASMSSKVDNNSKSGSGVGSKSLHEQWRETYNEDPYD
ncbi:gag-aspartyl protease domain-containing protein [Tanacetum coccineum]